MSLRRVLGMVFIALNMYPLSAQKVSRYRIYLRDKVGTSYALDHPQAFLSIKALERRARQQLPVDSTDLPLNKAYVDGIKQAGVDIVTRSKWNNTVLVQTTDSVLVDRIASLPFVLKTRRVWVEPDSIPERNSRRKEQVKKQVEKTENYYGNAFRQIALHHGDSLHAAGFKGKGMEIAVIDAGFYNVDVIPAFKDIDLLGTRDFVNPRSDIYAEHAHGMMVLSCMAARMPHGMVGTAPEAAYWLLRSEDNDTEQLVEEDYWAAAVEFADSAGVDVINTSLGYDAFDDPADAYRYRDLDGHCSLMSNAASMVAKKGMVLVCSAGNSGSKPWKKVTPPGDAEEIITVGAVDGKGINANFSSVGNTADGRIKPDVMALGVYVCVLGGDGQPSHGNGTSFASPTLCGLIACFWQACPYLTAKQVVEAIRRSGDRKDYPDNIYGYGVADVWKAYRENRR